MLFLEFGTEIALLTAVFKIKAVQPCPRVVSMKARQFPQPKIVPCPAIHGDPPRSGYSSGDQSSGSRRSVSNFAEDTCDAFGMLFDRPKTLWTGSIVAPHDEAFVAHRDGSNLLGLPLIPRHVERDIILGPHPTTRGHFGHFVLPYFESFFFRFKPAIFIALTFFMIRRNVALSALDNPAIAEIKLNDANVQF